MDDLTEDTYPHLFKRLHHISALGYSVDAFVEPQTLAYLLEVVAEIVRRHGTGVLQDVPTIVLPNELG